MFDLGSLRLSADKALPSDKARTLLRRLRDLNLSSGPVALTHRLDATLAGCMSLDGPAESGVRYRVRLSDGREGRLEIGFSETHMTLSLATTSPDEPAFASRDLSVAVTCDRKGRACARTIGARVTPESTDTRELEHFLRRVVRALAA